MNPNREEVNLSNVNSDDNLITQKPSHVTQTSSQSAGHNFDPNLRVQYANEPDVVHAYRPVEPDKPEISEEVRRRHDESVKKYPFLNLSEGEYVIISLRRHPMGLILPIAITSFIILILLSSLLVYPIWVRDNSGLLGLNSSAILPGYDTFVLVVLGLIALIGVGGYIAVWVYLQNKFFMTNESVIQEIQHSLFSRHEQTVSLGSIEDASFKKSGIIQTLMDYGTIRLSTEGEETTYRFHYVTKPKEQVAILNNAVEAFKNGRPVE